MREKAEHDDHVGIKAYVPKINRRAEEKMQRNVER